MRHIRRLSVKEYRAVVALLEQDHDDIVELAKNIVRMLNNMRSAESTWVRAVQEGSGALLYGPYRSAEEALTDDLSVGSMKAGPERVQIYSLIPPFGQAAEEREDRERE